MVVVLTVRRPLAELVQLARAGEELKEPVGAAQAPRAPALCLILVPVEGSRLHLRLAGVLHRVSDRLASLQQTVVVRDLVALPAGPLLKDWVRRTPEGKARTGLEWLQQRSARLVDLDDQAWEAASKALLTRPWEGDTEIRRLLDLLLAPREDNARLLVERQKRDHTVLGLRASGFSDDVVKVVTSVRLPQEGPQSHLDLLLAKTREDLQIQHDATHLPGWMREIGQGVSVNRVVFQDDVGHRLSIADINREKHGEDITGADLLYYRQDLRSYVFVQYKVFKRARGTTDRNGLSWHPNSDSNYGKQRALFRQADRLAAERSIAPVAGDADYRMHQRACWLKLCHPEGRPVPGVPDGLVEGMYLPFDYLEALIGEEALNGPQGGVRVDYELVPRYLNTTLFTDLIKGGWIGSPATEEDFLGLVKDAVEQGRSVSVATSPGLPRRKQGRSGARRGGTSTDRRLARRTAPDPAEPGPAVTAAYLEGAVEDRHDPTPTSQAALLLPVALEPAGPPAHPEVAQEPKASSTADQEAQDAGGSPSPGRASTEPGTHEQLDLFSAPSAAEV